MAPLFRPNEFVIPSNINEVPRLLKQYGKGARIIAGGTGFYELAKRGMIPEVEKIISLQKVGLSYVKVEGDVSIGSTTTLTDLASKNFVQNPSYGAIKDALTEIRPAQVRNVASVGGEVCLALPLVDLPVALLALNAQVIILGSEGQRTLPLEKFYLDYFLTDLKKDELVTEIRIPNPPGKTGSSFHKIGRSSYDFALISAAASITLEKDDKVRSSNIFLGGITRTPIRAERVEKAIRGKLTDQNMESAVESLRNTRPLGSIHGSAQYKSEILGILVRDVIAFAAERARQVD